MKVLLVTVAGLSSRFSESLGRNCLKCIYYENDPKEALLYQMLHQRTDFERYVIVGGFQFEKLSVFIHQYLPEIENKITLINNEKYAEYGSGYSLYLGLREIVDTDFSEVLFAEGDLYVDNESFCQVCNVPRDVITYNREAIMANKAVAFYFDQQERVHYIYDTKHNTLEIKEPFLGIFNSGQIWKFIQSVQVRRIFSEISEKDWRGTNLVFIQKYFEGLTGEEYRLVELRTWINCNTITDFHKMTGKLV